MEIIQYFAVWVCRTPLQKLLQLFYTGFWGLISRLFPAFYPIRPNWLTPLPPNLTTRPKLIKCANYVFHSRGIIPYNMYSWYLTLSLIVFHWIFHHVPHFRGLQSTIIFVGRKPWFPPTCFIRTPWLLFHVLLISFSSWFLSVNRYRFNI
jgi:hypothetical protein